MNDDASYLREALRLAALGRGQTSPNPAVGAVIVHDGEVVGRGFHTWKGMQHAETLALQEAGEQAKGATAYVSLEPCSHAGRTPPCSQGLIDAGVARVVCAMEDPNPLVKGQGFAALRAAGIQVDLLPEFTAEAAQLNEAFVHFMRTGRPLVILKSAVTLDGKIAAPWDNSGWITSERARAHVQELRHQCDAILTGIGTLLSDDCLLTDRSGIERPRPLLRIVVDSLLRTPAESKMVKSCQGDVLIATTSAADPARKELLEKAGVRVVAFDGARGRVSLRKLVDYLASQRYLSLMIEAGSKINWAALEEDIVDKIFFYYAPKVLGGLQSLPVAGGIGKMSRAEAIVFERLQLHLIPPDEFAVEAYVVKA
ncbi:MAG: bifunctional diaminohydroxyphosphoribosylaminopyrimidine deaminase/5-amino-6-(5-phosphoribosylamino)uracil reductase RibD [Bryobacterales bacterium]|nr:bifunctional diaminohydroxyphosphoribosylaminopyrimidine deaminase/5-amino-6-(5-phosphoribosylamino)uracil reductase RibD [Bryobacterales bacterium]